MNANLNKEQLNELLYQALETEKGGVEIYEKAIECAVNKDLKKEWTEYLNQTKEHQATLVEVLKALGLDIGTETPGRAITRHLGQSFLTAMQMAQDSGELRAAELVASECVVLAETKDHLNWELLSAAAEASDDKTADVLEEACNEVEEEEDHHLYHTKGYVRELWLKALGLPAVLPPPEEQKDVSTAIGAARAEHAREQML
jgi:rubrerythrin